MANVYDKGDLVQCACVFTDGNGAALDPGTVTFKVTNPAGTTTTYVYGTDAQLVKSGTGNYYVNVSAAGGGEWLYRFESTGTGQAAVEGRFRVQGSAF
jgi:uncharacterized protein YfaS (alpha-2-macroglobulin family)